MKKGGTMNGVLAAILMVIVVVARAGDVEKGKAIYDAKCVTCHSKDGKGNPAMAKMFKIERAAMDFSSEQNQKKTDADLTKFITDGKGKMPSFKGKLKDAEIASALAFIRSLAPAAPKAAKPEAKEAKPESKPKSETK